MKQFFNAEGMKSIRVLIDKEISDYIRSKKFIILLLIVLFTSVASLYSALATLRNNIPSPDTAQASFFFLQIFTHSDGTLPPFHVFISFLGPLLGICLGFDAINAEYTNRSLTRILAQPIARDGLLNAKFIGALVILFFIFVTLICLTVGLAIFWTGLTPSLHECLRLMLFLLVTIAYVGFWLNLSLLFSVIWKHPATSALVSIAIWLFFMVFYPMIIGIVAKSMAPGMYASNQEIQVFQNFILSIMRLAPNQLYEDGTLVLLMPNVRSLSPLSMEQVQGAIPTALPVWESVKVVWTQVTALVASTVICFACSYFIFMRREIRA